MFRSPVSFKAAFLVQDLNMEALEFYPESFAKAEKLSVTSLSHLSQLIFPKNSFASIAELVLDSIVRSVSHH